MSKSSEQLQDTPLFYEFKSGDKAQTLQVLAERALGQDKTLEPNASTWVFYVNDRRRDSLNQTIRPRSKVLMISRAMPLPHIEVVFESKELLVLNKPCDLPTQKTLKRSEDNLYDRVRMHSIIEQGFPPGLPYVGLHHRLDRMTSGLVLMTKQRSANKIVSDLFQHKKIKKEYLAYCAWGNEAPAKAWTESNKISRGINKRHPFYFVISENGDEAVTDFKLLQSLEGEWHKIQCFPRTGRTHQLRVQLKNRGWSILGDPVYGRKKSAQRLMLHARRLDFEFRGQRLSVEVEPTWIVPEPQA